MKFNHLATLSLAALAGVSHKTATAFSPSTGSSASIASTTIKSRRHHANYKILQQRMSESSSVNDEVAKLREAAAQARAEAARLAKVCIKNFFCLKLDFFVRNFLKVPS